MLTGTAFQSKWQPDECNGNYIHVVTDARRFSAPLTMEQSLDRARMVEFTGDRPNRNRR